MAERDEALHYLLNKLRSEDGWSSVNLAWNDEKLAIISDQFSGYDGVAKAKVLLSFLGMTPRTISQCSNEMQHILQLARRDGDEWVRLFACILGPFPHSQTITLEECPESSLEGVLEEVADALSCHSGDMFVPLEYAYLNSAVLQCGRDYAVPEAHEHFVLVKQPQSAQQLRTEMLQRAGTDFSQTGSLVKDRHVLQRQLSSSGVNPFVPTSSRTSTARKSVPIPGMSSNRIHRERGTKLLDISDVPVNIRRKRKLATIDTEGGGLASKGESKKSNPPRTPTKQPDQLPHGQQNQNQLQTTATAQQAAAATAGTPGGAGGPPSQPNTPAGVVTPDYVAALGLFGSVQQQDSNPSLYQVKAPQRQATSNPTLAQLHLTTAVARPSTSGVTTPTATPTPTNAPPAPLPTVAGAPPPPSSSSSGPSMGAPPPTPHPAQYKQPTKGLKLSRQQLQIAQDIFKESPSLTREEKALILGFMAGSRENPYPDHEVVTVKLNEKQVVEEVANPTAEGKTSTRKVLLETVFEMNYTNGRWRKLQYKRVLSM